MSTKPRKFKKQSTRLGTFKYEEVDVFKGSTIDHEDVVWAWSLLKKYESERYEKVINKKYKHRNWVR